MTSWLVNGFVWAIVAMISVAVILIAPGEYDTEVRAEEWGDFPPSGDGNGSLQ